MTCRSRQSPSFDRLARLEAELEQAKTKLLSAHEFADDLREELDQREDQVRSCDIEIARLSKGLRKASADAARWQGSADDWMRQVGQLQATLESANRTLRVMWPAEVETPDKIKEWAAETFGEETLRDLVKKLLIEIAELDRSLYRPGGEPTKGLADVLIVLCRIMSVWPELGAAIDRKMALNRIRLWERGTDGAWKHVPEVAA
ncbi:MAG: hypothetical protein LBM75_09380 [Myxococcales bacterium]|jgi:septal ring factor EnvC (AmiA/AmiB activator)|nr:hypothetical protein [Myxococcales bacterium]